MKTLERGNRQAPALIWNLADAKNRFSQVVDLALHDVPQTVSRRGEKVIVISEKAYQRLRGVEHSFLDFLFTGPGLEGVDLGRNKSLARKVLL
jgi:prevent-host-death family protein